MTGTVEIHDIERLEQLRHRLRVFRVGVGADLDTIRRALDAYRVEVEEAISRTTQAVRRCAERIERLEDQLRRLDVDDPDQNDIRRALSRARDEHGGLIGHRQRVMYHQQALDAVARRLEVEVRELAAALDQEGRKAESALDIRTRWLREASGLAVGGGLGVGVATTHGLDAPSGGAAALLSDAAAVWDRLGAMAHDLHAERFMIAGTVLALDLFMRGAELGGVVFPDDVAAQHFEGLVHGVAAASSLLTVPGLTRLVGQTRAAVEARIGERPPVGEVVWAVLTASRGEVSGAVLDASDWLPGLLGVPKEALERSRDPRLALQAVGAVAEMLSLLRDTAWLRRELHPGMLTAFGSYLIRSLRKVQDLDVPAGRDP